MIHSNVTGIVLAGGNSSRMGTDKALLMLRGKPLIQYAVEVLRKVCEYVVISSNRTDYEFTGCETWPDIFPQQAPMIGIYSCLKRSGSDINVVLSCDMPLADPRLFDILLAYSGQHDIILPVHGDDCIEPLCGIYNRSVLSGFKESINLHHFGLLRYLKSSEFKAVEVNPGKDFNNPNMFVNVNTINDFDLLCKS